MRLLLVLAEVGGKCDVTLLLEVAAEGVLQCFRQSLLFQYFSSFSVLVSASLFLLLVVSFTPPLGLKFIRKRKYEPSCLREDLLANSEHKLAFLVREDDW